MLRPAILGLLFSSLSALAGTPAESAVEDFAFIHISDIHVGPHLIRTGRPGPLPGAESVAWVCREAAKPQALPESGIVTPMPAFALATGDLTEYGVIDDTFAQFDKAFESLPFPLYVTPGNHDNTWVAMYHIMRQRYGGEDYSFDKFGCHFAMICSASPQEPMPTINAKTRAWLKRDLDRVPPGTPVFVGLHHPPTSSEFANPAEYDTLVDLLRDYNVVLVLYGHGHYVEHRNMDGIDGVMGGSTWGPSAGYAVVSVQDGTLRVAYHYYQKPAAGEKPATGEAEQESTGAGWQKVLEKPLARGVPTRLFEIAAPKRGDVVGSASCEVVLEIAGERAGDQAAEVWMDIDGKEAQPEVVAARAPPTWRISADKLSRGWHLLTVRVKTADGAQDLRTTTFVAGNDPQPCVWRKEFPAAVKAGPVVAGDKVMIARMDGAVTAVERATGRELWTFTTGGEILGTPAWSGRLLVFGSGDGKVYAVDGAGVAAWTFDAGQPVYGAPLIEGDTVFLGDNGGRLHALELKTGAARWTFARADYSIECRPCVWGERTVFGAWDGYLYAVGQSDGKLSWKVLGPKASVDKAARYYAPADCGPLALGETLFVCDRGYFLGTFGRDGAAGKRLAENVCAIGVAPGAAEFYGRRTDDHVCKFSAAGEKLWDQAVPAGRFPVPPTCQREAVYVCSNRGLLSVLDAADGKAQWTYQVTPGFYVLAPVAVDEQGACYVAGMDGTVTALRAAAP